MVLLSAGAAPGLAQPGGQVMHPIEEEVDVAVRGRLDPGDPLDLAERGEAPARSRGRLPEPPGEFERERDREVAERAARRDVHGNGGKDRVIGGAIELVTASAIRVRTMRWTGRIMQAHETSITDLTKHP